MSNKVKSLKNITLTELNEILSQDLLNELRKNNHNEYKCVIWIENSIEEFNRDYFDKDEYIYVLKIFKQNFPQYIEKNGYKDYINMTANYLYECPTAEYIEPIMSIEDSAKLLDLLDQKYHKYLCIKDIKKNSIITVSITNYGYHRYDDYEIYENGIDKEVINCNDHVTFYIKKFK